MKKWQIYYNRIEFFFLPSQGKKKLPEQCDLDENAVRTVNEKLDSQAVESVAETALNNQKVKREYESAIKALKEGINPVDIGKKSTVVGKNKVLIKKDRGRFLVEISDNQVKVLGIGDRGNTPNMNKFKRLMNKMYDVNLQY